MGQRVATPEIDDFVPLAGLPACDIGRAYTADGISAYVLLCPELYDRDGKPCSNESGRDWRDSDVRFGRFASAAAEIAAGLVDPGHNALFLTFH